MTSFQRVLRVLLMAMTGLLALTAIPGGAMLVLGIYQQPLVKAAADAVAVFALK